MQSGGNPPGRCSRTQRDHDGEPVERATIKGRPRSVSLAARHPRAIFFGADPHGESVDVQNVDRSGAKLQACGVHAIELRDPTHGHAGARRLGASLRNGSGRNAPAPNAEREQRSASADAGELNALHLGGTPLRGVGRSLAGAVDELGAEGLGVDELEPRARRGDSLPSRYSTTRATRVSAARVAASWTSARATGKATASVATVPARARRRASMAEA